MKQITKEDIDNYIDQGQRPSGFVEAVLSNDLVEAFRLADEQNLQDMLEIVRYCHNNVPVGAWGDRVKVKGWLKHGGKQQYLER